MEKYIYPGKPNYRSNTLKPKLATYENKIIKQLLQDLVYYAGSVESSKSDSNSSFQSLKNEQELYFQKSSFEIQSQLQSVENIVSSADYERIHEKLSTDVKQREKEEQLLRQSIKEIADFSETPSRTNEFTYIEVVLEMNGPFTIENSYSHYQSANDMKAFLKYDRRHNHFKIRHYILPNDNSIIRPNSHFGTITLTGTHVLSHARFYKIFSEEGQRRSATHPCLIHIGGYVKRQSNSNDDPVVTLTDTNFNSYKFDFIYITEIKVNQVDIHITKNKEALQLFLENDLPVLVEGTDRSEDTLMEMKQLEKLKFFTKQLEDIQFKAEQFSELKETANQLLDLDLFSHIDLSERLPVVPTQLFLHDPIYRVAWQAIKRIKHELSASLFFGEYQHLIGTSKVEQVFEVWTLYKMLHLLTTDMGWILKESQSATQYLDDYLTEKKALKDFSATLYWNTWEVTFYYEPTINTAKSYRCPDYVLKFKKGGVAKGMAILDAKYRNYASQGKSQWVKDVKDIAIEKYGSLQSVDDAWKDPLLASGIVHSDVNSFYHEENEFNPYHVMYNETLFDTTLSEEKPHHYNAISLIPSKVDVFKNWFRMIMEYHLEEYSVCWSCGEAEAIKEKRLSTKKGYTKYYYTCESCSEFWVKVHCRKRHDIIKHMNNYHLQVEGQNKWWIICPECGDGRPQF